MSLFFDLSGFVFGVLGLLGVFQLIRAAVRYYLPTQRFKALEEVYSDTYSIFRSGVEEGLFLHVEAQG